MKGTNEGPCGIFRIFSQATFFFFLKETLFPKGQFEMKEKISNFFAPKTTKKYLMLDIDFLMQKLKKNIFGEIEDSSNDFPPL